MDKKQVTISVIIPVYNVEKYLVDCLESVVNQTVSFNQIIIINDGSTDNSLSICEQYQKKYDNVFMYSQENQGLAAARNKGMEFVNSEYLIFLDSDDYLAVDTVERLKYWIKKDSLDVVYYDADILNECKDRQFENHYDRVGKIPSEILAGKEYFFRYFPELFPTSACLVCLRDSFLKEKQITFPPIRAHEDEMFSFIAALEADKVKYIPERFYFRRYREGSIMTSEMTLEKCSAYGVSYKLRWEYSVKRLIDWGQEEAEFLKRYMIRDYMSIKMKMNQLGLWSSDVEMVYELQQCFCDCWKKLSKDSNHSLWFFKCFFDFYAGLDSTSDQKLKEELWLYERNMRKEYIHRRIAQLPLKDEAAKVGIYGTGYHTEQLFLWYRYLCGEIKCKLYFLDTYKETGVSEYMERPIVNISDAKDYVDYIIISSIKYEAEMKETVTKLYGNSIPISCFYEENKEKIFYDFEEFSDV